MPHCGAEFAEFSRSSRFARAFDRRLGQMEPLVGVGQLPREATARPGAAAEGY